MDFSAVLDFCTQIKNKTAAKPFSLFWVFVIYYCKQVARPQIYRKEIFPSWVRIPRPPRAGFGWAEERGLPGSCALSTRDSGGRARNEP